MSHKPPVPDAATSPYPLHPGPIEHVETADGKTGDAPDKGEETPVAKLSNRTLGIAAAGAAIGSAAVAAALIFYNRPATPTKRTAPPKPKRAAKPKTTAAKPTSAKSTLPRPASVKTATAKPAPKPRAGARAKPKPKPKSGSPT